MDVANRILAVGFCLATLVVSQETQAVNAVETLPLPCPQRCLTDVAAPVAFDETTNVAVACPDAARRRFRGSRGISRNGTASTLRRWGQTQRSAFFPAAARRTRFVPIRQTA